MRLLDIVLALATLAICQAKSIHKRQALNTGTCAYGWRQLGESCYRLVKNKSSWIGAEANCNTKGGHLASSNSAAEQALIENYVNSRLYDDSETYVWIGLSDQATEGTWRWSDNSPVNFTNWYDAQQQPNGKREENCAAIEVNSNKWFDRPCGDPHMFVCEAKPTPVITQETFDDCSFEYDLCGYTTDATGTDFPWERNSGMTSSSGTGPDYAADGAHYVYIETSSPRLPGYVARLTSPVYDNKNCDTEISFFYHMYGDDVETLNVKIVAVEFSLKEKVVFTQKGGQGNEWKNATVVVPKSWGKFNLVFEGIRGNSYKGDIAIDKVVFQQPGCGGTTLKICPEPPTVKYGSKIYEAGGSDVTYECPVGLTLRGYGTQTNTFHCKKDNSWDIRTSELVCEVECAKNRTYVGTVGIIASPGYPGNYHNNAKCSWTILGKKGHKLILDFDYFESEFMYDNLEVYAHPSGKLLERLSGKSTPTAVLDSDSIYMLWKTDSANTGKGFYLNWRVSTCAVPANPVNGKTLYGGVEKGDVAYYNCNEGYELIGGANSAVCEENGTWSASVPQCTLKSCPPLGQPTNGYVKLKSVTFGSIAKYQCDLEYQLKGPAKRFCQANGTWSGENPTCDVPDCGPIETPSFGKKFGQDTIYRSIVRFTCLYGVQTVNGFSGSLQRTCQVDGTWSGTPIKCVDPVQCDFEQGYCGLRETSKDKLSWVLTRSDSGQSAVVQTNQGTRMRKTRLLSREFHPTLSCYTLKFKYSLAGSGTLQVYKLDRALFSSHQEVLLKDLSMPNGNTWTDVEVEVTAKPYSYMTFAFEATMYPSKNYNFVRLDDIKLEEGCKSQPSTQTTTTMETTTKLATLPPSTPSPEPSTPLSWTTESSTTSTKPSPTTLAPTIRHSSTDLPSTHAPTTPEPSSEAPTTVEPSTEALITPKTPSKIPTTVAPTNPEPSTHDPTTVAPSTKIPITHEASTETSNTIAPTKPEPNTDAPTEAETSAPTKPDPTTQSPSVPSSTPAAPNTPQSETDAPTRPAETTVVEVSSTAVAVCSPKVANLKTGDGFIAESPGFGGNSYPTELECIWTAQHVGDGHFKIKFTDFDLLPRDSSGSCKDSVEIYSYSDESDTSKTRILCGREALTEMDYLVQKPTEIRIRFTTDASAEFGYNGFQAGILAVPNIV